MSTLEKVFAGFTMVALATTLVLPKRQTPQVINALTGLIRGTYATVMGTGKAV